MERSAGYAWVSGVMIGATAMYFLDPNHGRRRRAFARDKVVRALNVTEESVDRLATDMTNRAQGAMARAQRLVSGEGVVDDEKLEARVRAALGRLVTHPRMIQVLADDGVVTLRGTVLQDEVGRLLASLRRVPGVRRVESQVTPVPNAPRTSEQPAPKPAPGMVPDMLQRNMSPTSRAISGAAGAVLSLWGLRRRDAPGLAAALTGGFLLARAVTNLEPGQILTVGTGEAITVQKNIEVAAPIRDVFAFWSNFRNFPRFMQHLREVSESESGTSHWVADGPAGMPVSWEAEITALKPYQQIAWKSLSGSMVENAGEVRFEEIHDRRTRICVRMTYHPPAGALGHAVATCFGANPKRQLDDDLARLKSLLETGKASAHGQTVERTEVEPETAS